MPNEMFEFVQFPAGIIKRLVAKATNAVIMSGLGIGIGSALLLSLLKHIFRKARTLEVLSPPENEDEPSQNDDPPLVFLITQKKSKFHPELESSCLISSPSSSSNSSMSLIATDTHVSEMELKPLPELMLLDESLRDKLKDDYIVLVISPRKSDVNHHGDEDSDNNKTTPSHVANRENESLRNVRSSFDVSINRILNNSLKRFSTPQLQAHEETKEVLGNDGDHDDNGNFRDCETASEPGEEGCSGSFSLARDMSLISTATADSTYLLTSAEMKSIFEGEQISSDSLFGNSDVMKKLADIEEKLCLVHVDTDNMMSYINAVRRSEKISAILSRPQNVCFDHLIMSTPSDGSLVDRPSYDRGAEFMLDLDLNEDLSAADDPKNFDEWSFEDQLGDPNDISF